MISMCRVAAAYDMHPDQVLRHFTVTGSRPRHASGRVRADAELLLNEGGQRMLAGLSGVDQDVLDRALPAFPHEDAKTGTDGGVARGVACGWGWGAAGGVRLPFVRGTVVRGRSVSGAPCAAPRTCPGLRLVMPFYSGCGAQSDDRVRSLGGEDVAGAR